MLNNLFGDIFGGVVRHVAGSGATWLFLHGIISQSDEQKFVGSVCFLGVVAWSAYQKYSKRNP